MTCMLPVDHYFTPYMTVDVYDHIYTGEHQPLIGTFHIMIGDIKEAQSQRHARETEVNQGVLNYLREFIKKSEAESM